MSQSPQSKRFKPSDDLKEEQKQTSQGIVFPVLEDNAQMEQPIVSSLNDTTLPLDLAVKLSSSALKQKLKETIEALKLPEHDESKFIRRIHTLVDNGLNSADILLQPELEDLLVQLCSKVITPSKLNILKTLLPLIRQTDISALPNNFFTMSEALAGYFKNLYESRRTKSTNQLDELKFILSLINFSDLFAQFAFSRHKSVVAGIFDFLPANIEDQTLISLLELFSPWDRLIEFLLRRYIGI
jgi:hypothetical protein